jgi:two-component system sensor histidine kinase PhoQ
MLGIEPAVLPVTPTPGSAYFQEITATAGTALFVLSFTVSWEIDTDKYRLYTFRVAETQRGFDAQVQGFRRSLWGWFLAAALVLLLVQSLILRWGLKPLRQVAQEVTDIETGRRTALAGPYPRELRPLTRNLDAFIHDSRTRLERSRHALGDLAHSLKTPLAILRGAVESESSPTQLRQTVREQLGRMNQTVEYQLQRAAAAGRIAMAAPTPVAPLVQKIVQSLSKVYAGKHLRFQIEIGEGLGFHGDEGDFMEIIGNLADNACKWSHSRVAIRASQGAVSPAELLLDVEDDGPGIPSNLRRAILERGMRADPNTVGHGIGLAVVRNLVEEVYRGSLEIDTGSLGGARIRVRLQRS